jgi:hypothetical protein
MTTKTCHSDPSHVFNVGKAQVWAGSKDAIHSRKWGLVISATHATLSNPFTANEVAKALLPKELYEWSPPAQLKIDWPDGGEPPVGCQWWEQLWAFLRSFDGEVFIHCHGGHGRTGTALAILAGLEGLAVEEKQRKGRLVLKPVNPILFVRRLYCKKAVETWSQIDYIDAVLGITSNDVVPSNSVTSSVYGNSANYGQYGAPTGYHGGGAGGQSQLPLTNSQGTADNSPGGRSSLNGGGSKEKTEPGDEMVPDTLYRWNDKYGTYWTDERGNIVATQAEDFDEPDEETARPAT